YGGQCVRHVARQAHAVRRLQSGKRAVLRHVVVRRRGLELRDLVRAATGSSGTRAVPDAERPGLTMFGGAQGEESDAVKMADTWRFEYAGSPREVCAAGVDSDGDKLVGCDDPDCWYRCR